MKTTRWTTPAMLLALCAAPAAAQMPGMMRQGAVPHGAMHQGMMAPCTSGNGMGRGAMGQGMMGAGMGAGMFGSGMMGWMGAAGMMRGPGADPVALLGAADDLGLTPAQRDRLDAIAGTERQDRQEQMGVAMRAYQRAADAMQPGSTDLKVYERGLQEAADAMVQAQVAMARARTDANEVLTPEQRAKLQESMALVGSMMCGELDASGSTGPGAGPGGSR